MSSDNKHVKIFKDDISIVISGEAGQGIQTIETLLSRASLKAGFNVFAYGEFMSRIRGGNNSSEIRISSRKVDAFTDRIDFLFPLNQDAMKRFRGRITESTVIIGEAENIEKTYIQKGSDTFNLPLDDLAKAAGGKIFMNTILSGFISALLNIEESVLLSLMGTAFHKTGPEILRKNIDAIKSGYSAAQEIKSKIGADILPAQSDLNKNILISGTEAIGIGALAGGCNFVASYPMSPSTGLLTFMAKNAERFEIIVEQAEDEICAVNMALGSWYAGGRAMVTTSGGGYDLMTEGLSLAGCIESPLVIHLAQRPGPATGLPTRTEQADLNLALYSGHGEFPRAVFAPGNYKQGIETACRAFNIADKYQIPVFILTDQYYLDSSYNIEEIQFSGLQTEKHIVKTDSNYKRYAVTENGVSPRSIPGYGGGTVCVDSDEHDQGGYITEDPDVRTMMTDKRLRKYSGMNDDILFPELTGSADYETLIVCWGSTYNSVKEAVGNINRDNVAIAHFCQVYPLHPDAGKLLNKARKKIIIENNATGQFAGLIRLSTGMDFDTKILKYNGMPFSVEELEKAIREKL